VVVVPSRWDALSLSLVEAAASGRCVVATDVPGAREILGDSERGAIVPNGDGDRLVAAVVRRLADPELAASEGNALGAWAREQLDRRRTFDRIAAIVEELVSARPVHQ
jgi:glycosyltransferase involved in cell wall biosynthesis